MYYIWLNKVHNSIFKFFSSLDLMFRGAPIFFCARGLDQPKSAPTAILQLRLDERGHRSRFESPFADLWTRSGKIFRASNLCRVWCARRTTTRPRVLIRISINRLGNGVRVDQWHARVFWKPANCRIETRRLLAQTLAHKNCKLVLVCPVERVISIDCPGRRVPFWKLPIVPCESFVASRTFVHRTI